MIAKVGAAGRVNLYVSSASAHLIVDVAGYFASSSDYVPLSPARIIESRNRPAPADADRDFGPFGTGRPRNSWWTTMGKRVDLPIVGRGGVPMQDIGAVVLNVTIVEPTGSGYATVYPLGSARPNASNINFAAGSTRANLVIAMVGIDGHASFEVEAPSAHIVVDVMGYFPGISTADVPGTYSFLARDDVGAPIAWDRCTPIRFANYLGIGGATWLSGGGDDPYTWFPKRFLSGHIYISRNITYPTGFGEGDTLGKIALHELGHVVGLHHVDNENELMYPYPLARAGRFGPGDLKGLWFLGRNQTCPSSNAVRLGVSATGTSSASVAQDLTPTWPLEVHRVHFADSFDDATAG